MRRHVTLAWSLIAFALLALLPANAFADTKSTIDSIERLPRPKRLSAYEKAIADTKNSAAADRLDLTRAFARHAQAVSPALGKGKFAFDGDAWILILKDGFAADPRDADIAIALAQLQIDRGDTKAALHVVKAFKAGHPQHHHALAWIAWCESGGKPKEETLTFPVHFCVLTKNPAAEKAATLQQCRKEVDILNSTFRTLDGKPLVRFEFKGFTPHAQIKDAPDELKSYGDREAAYDTDAVAKAFNACKNDRLRDQSAINFYVYDSHSVKAGFADQTSHGKRNSNRPFVLLDWQRLDGALQNAEAHEMGHCFGLEHVGVPGAKEKTSTNIMTSVSEQFGSGGLRDLGFTPSQSALILYHAKRTQDRLRLAPKQ